LNWNRPTPNARPAAAAIAAIATVACVSQPGVAPATEAFARQTGRACNACHTRGYPLTPFGEAFKANKYKVPRCKQMTIRLYDRQGVFKRTYSGCFPIGGSKVTIGQ
jgi:cytochrome c5